MPLIQFDTIENALDSETKKRLADTLTACVVNIIGEKIKAHTWVIFNESPEGNFFIGGHPISAKTYQKMMLEKK